MEDVTGYRWISVIALFCYLFLFMAFLAARKSKKVINTFMWLQVIMLLWSGGSFAMRAELWPGVNFWNAVSILGIFMLPMGYYCFMLDFLEHRDSRGKKAWLALYTLAYVVNCATGIFVPNPEVIQRAGGVQFVYEYSWPVYALFAVTVVLCIQVIALVWRYCKGDQSILPQLKPIIWGASIMVACHIAATLPTFHGFPLDILSGVVNAVLMFYALYRKRLFRMTLLVSRGNCYAAALLICVVVFSNCIMPVQQFLTGTVGLETSHAIIAIAVGLVLCTYLLYSVMKGFLDSLFIREEQAQGDLLTNFSRAVAKVLNMNEILQELVEVIQKAVGVHRMFIFVRGENGDFHVAHTGSPLDERGFVLSADNPLIGYLQHHVDCLMLRDFSRTISYRSMWDQEKQLFAAWNIEYFVPMMADEDLIGIVMLSAKARKGSYNSDDLNFLQSATSVCAIAVKNAQLYEKAYEEARKDELTGLINRKYFYEILNREFERAKDTSLALVIFNVDDFKLYNQLYGAREGDKALQRIAAVMQATIGDHGYVARLSGKEFGLILPGYDIYSAKLLGENIAKQVREINHIKDGYGLSRMTMSVGICASPYMASSPQELINNADMAVYTVKRAGKNGVLMYSEDIEKREQRPKNGGHRSGYSEYASTIYALTAAIDTKDHYTFSHSQNVAYYASELAKAYGMNQEFIEIVKEAGLLHDIGKIGIREDILNKPGSLTAEEYEIMKGHVENAAGIIRYLPSLDYVIPAVLSHHERYDGNGYPRKLSGEDIPIMGRILCIADSFDAMTSVRSYKRSFPTERAIQVLEEEAGRQFDPKLVPIFVSLLRSGQIEVKAHSDRAGQRETEPVLQ